MNKSTEWPQSALDKLGKVKDLDIATEFGMSRATVRNKRIELRIPKFNDRRAQNGGHSTAGKAGRPKEPDRKSSKSIAMRQWAWDWLDDPKNGAARGVVIEQLISDKIATLKNN